MEDYIAVIRDEDSIQVCFYVDRDEVMAIGKKMNEIREEAYMNGYNWDAFLNCYLEKNAPDVLDEMDTDPEGGMYAAYYPLTPENDRRAKELARTIRSLIEKEEDLYQFVREMGEEIEWD